MGRGLYMKIYKLKRYAWDEAELCFEHTDKELMESKALEMSEESGNTYTYRLETWIDDELKMGFRFFQNGREFTQDLRNACLDKLNF